MSREPLRPDFSLPDKGRIFPAPRLRFDFMLDLNDAGYHLRGTLIDLGREDLLGHDESRDGLVPREDPPSSDTVESFLVDGPTIATVIDAIVRKAAQGRICSRSAQLVTTGPAGIREALAARWLA